METKKAPLSIRIIYWITNVFFWLMVIDSFGLMVGNVLLDTGLTKDIGLLGRVVPVTVNILESGQLHHGNQITTLKLKVFTVGIEIVNQPKFITKKIALINLLILLILIYLTWVFRKFVKNVKKGETFSIKNISLLKRISYVMVCSWLVKTIYSQFAYFYIKGHFSLAHIQIMSNGFFFNLHTDILWDALFLWALAHIFITGLKLKQEKELTI